MHIPSRPSYAKVIFMSVTPVGLGALLDGLVKFSSGTEEDKPDWETQGNTKKSAGFIDLVSGMHRSNHSDSHFYIFNSSEGPSSHKITAREGSQATEWQID